MTNSTRVAQAKHLESSAAAAKRFLLSKVFDVTEAVSSELENLSGMTIDTSQPTVDGALWYQLLDDGLQLCLHYGGHDYSLDGAPAAPEMICEFQYPDRPYNSVKVTVLSNWADFGVQENDSPQGAELYMNLVSITCTQDDSTIICNAANNHITICGGENNSLIGGIGIDQYYFAGGGGTIGDFGVNVTKNINGTTLPSNTQTSNYDRTDPDSYSRQRDVLQVNGTVTAIAVPDYSKATSVTRQLAHFDATVYYVDEFNQTHSIYLPNVLKQPAKTGSNGYYYAHNHTTYGAPSLKIYDMSSGSMATIKPADFIYDPNA